MSGIPFTEIVHVIVVVIFALLALGCILLSVAGLPGAWMMIALAVIVELIDSAWGGTTTWGWTAIAVCGGLALVGEVIELLSSAMGAKIGGASKRGMVAAIIGGIVGAIVCTPLIPIPLVGTLIGAVIGTFAGAVIGEMTREDPPSSGKIAVSATTATIGRILGVVAKAGIAAICFAILVISAFWSP